jgi:type VI secretion system protein ImpC
MVDMSLANVEGELVATMEAEESRLSDDIPFQVLLIGDWSGRTNRPEPASSKELKASRPLLVDRDNLDQLIARLGVKLSIALRSDGNQPLAVNFNELEDFHPDRLFSRLEIFAGLRRTRAELEDVETFSAAAARVRHWEAAPPTAKSAVTEEPAPEKFLAGNILDRILAGTEETSSAGSENQQAEVSAEIFQLAKSAVQPYLSPDIERDQDELIAVLDARTADLMNAILHHKDFQALETAWRGLDLLVRRLETGTNLKIYLLDMSFDEFKADLREHDDFRSAALYKLLVEEASAMLGGVPWSVVGANYSFDFKSGDGDVVESMAAIAQAAGAPFVAGVPSDLLGCQSLAATPDPDDWRLPPDKTTEDWWKRITHLSSARYVGFALPRFLLRLPYGRSSDPTEDFKFEELGSSEDKSQEHESYLWANPAFAVVFLLARGFSEDGPEFRPSDHLEIEGLPMHVYEHHGATEIKPCAEVLLTLRAAEKIIDRGLMPLLSIKNSDRIRLGMCQSITGTGLGGRWLTKRKD